jgi:hypothetical protein
MNAKNSSNTDANAKNRASGFFVSWLHKLALEVNIMETFENLQFESEVHFKLKEAEREAQETNKRYSSAEVLSAMREAIGKSA